MRVRRPARPDVFETIPNPLYSYEYPGLQKITAAGVPISPTTGRWAGFNPGLTRTFRHLVSGSVADSDNVDVQRAFVPGPSSLLQALQEKVYTVLTVPQSYRAFATDSYEQGEALAKGDATHADVINRFALESWHNDLESS